MSLEMPDSDTDKPMTVDVYSNRKSPEMILIGSLYSVQQPFYNELRKSCKTLDLSQLEILGPFARAVWGMLSNEGLGFMYRSFLLFKGALMNFE